MLNTDGSVPRFTEFFVDKGHMAFVYRDAIRLSRWFRMWCRYSIPCCAGHRTGRGSYTCQRFVNLMIITLCVLFPIFDYNRCQSTGHFSTRHFWGRALVLFWTRLTGTFSHSLPLGRSGYGLVAAFTSPMTPMSMSCPGLSFMWVVSINMTSSILLGDSQGFGGNGYAKGKGI